MWIIRALVRLIFIGLLMAAVGAAVIYGSWKLLHPVLLQAEQRKEVAQLEERVERLKQEHARLEKTVRRLSTVKGKAEELRRMGYVRPKERIVRFIKGPPADEAAPQPQPAAERPGVKNRIKHWLERRLPPPDDPS